MTFIIVRADLPYFESIYCWYYFTLTLTSPSLCVKVSPSLWSALLSASQLEKEGFKATPAINSKKQFFFNFSSCLASSPCFGLSLIWVSFFFVFKSLIFVFRFAETRLFAVFLRTCSFPLSFFLLHSFSAFKYHISYHFKFLFFF